MGVSTYVSTKTRWFSIFSSRPRDVPEMSEVRHKNVPGRSRALEVGNKLVEECLGLNAEFFRFRFSDDVSHPCSVLRICVGSCARNFFKMFNEV